jgi:P27 family predicted phage terminase small subunit
MSGNKPGRTPLPANVHRLRNNPSKLSEDDLEAKVVVPTCAPKCPVELSAPAKTEWRRIMPHLVAAGLITQLDRGALAGYCQAWGEWAVLEARVKLLMKQDGADGLIDITPSGYKQISALVQARDRALDRMLRFAKEFGLSPSSRVAATTGQQLSLPGLPADPMEGFLNAGDAVRTAS